MFLEYEILKKMKYLSTLLIVVLFMGVACNQQTKDAKQHRQTTHRQTPAKKVDDDNKVSGETSGEYYHAVVYDSMTLSQVAKANNIGLPFLKTKLGIPKSVTYDYSIKQLKKNFRFTTDRLKSIIEDSKNRTAVFSKKSKNKK